MHSVKAVKGSPEYQALSSYFENSNTCLEDVTDAFVAPVEQAATNNADMEPALWRCWQAVTHHAAQTPHTSPNRQRLADFLLRLQRRPDVLDKSGQPCKIWDEAIVWRDIPLFGAQIRECWNFDPANTKPAEQENLTAFLATLVHSAHNQTRTQNKQQASYPATPFTDLSLQLLWTLRAALENADSADSAKAPWLNSACLVLIHAAPTLKEYCQREESFEGKLGRAGDGVSDRYPGWRGFCMERWGVWYQGLKEKEQGGNLVGEARGAMEGCGV